MKSKKKIWKPISGYELLYEVSSLGRVRSLPRRVWQTGNKCEYYHTYKGRVLSLVLRPSGYYEVSLTDKERRKNYSVHYLVASAFLPNPHGLPQINHKNENKADNRVDNLEWCTAKHNSNHATRNLRAAMKRSVPVIAERNGYLFEFDSITEAARQTKACDKNIIACCRGRRKVAKGYHWRYKED